MALSNRQRVQGAQDALLEELVVYVEKALRNAYGDNWPGRVLTRYPGVSVDGVGKPVWDIQLLAKAIGDFWQDAFSDKLRPDDRNHVFELRSWRNALAHDQAFTYDDTHRAIDTMARVATAMKLPVAAQLVKDREEVLRLKFTEQARTVTRNLPPMTEGRIPEGLKAWRDIIIPHADVRDGKFQSAEFAADLAQVHRGDADSEYGDPQAFFARTFITAGLRDLLVNALRRLGDGEGDPVVELQTNFGGGKTHSMLALYHLFSGVAATTLPNLEAVLKEAAVAVPTGVNRAVLVGTDLGTSRRQQKDGTVTNTTWGELAYQLAGPTGYALVADADQDRVNPGADRLARLLELASPCLVLIDEWVAQLRELYRRDDLPAGSYESNISFAQSLTEAAKRVPRALVVASLPEGQTEVAGEGGAVALAELKQTFKRVQSSWVPANPEESFEIVRRRLFEDITGDGHRQRDAVVKAFGNYYRQHKADFPSEVTEAAYERRMTSSYPVHPALFDTLFGAWSTLERFQRTRGVLRLMAAVIHRLWQSGQHDLMILPGTLPVDDPKIQAELRNYLGEQWEAIIHQEVDGPESLPVRVEAENGRLGQQAAARRVTRTVFFDTAPKAGTSHPGVETRRINLGSIQPGESIGPFSDALRLVSQQAVYLYADATHYWFSTQPSLNRRAADLAQQFADHDVRREIEERLNEAAKRRGPFVGVHVTGEPGDVPDDAREPGARLVILPSEFPHVRGSDDSAAMTTAQRILTRKGSGDRIGRNNVVFLAADGARLPDLQARTRQYLAWAKIYKDAEVSDLTTSQRNQARARRDEHASGVDTLLNSIYTMLLMPESVEGGTVTMAETKMNGDGHLVERAARKLVSSTALHTALGGAPLRLRLEHTLWNGRPHLTVQQLMEYFAQYIYLERLSGMQVLLNALEDGLKATPPYFAYADGLDEQGQYLNLRIGEPVTVRNDQHALLVSLSAAQAQRDRETAEREVRASAQISGAVATTTMHTGTATSGNGEQRAGKTTVTPPPLPTHAFVQGELDRTRMVKRFEDIYNEIVQQLIDAGGNVKVEITVRADVPGGIPIHLQRAVTVNASSLGLEEPRLE